MKISYDKLAKINTICSGQMIKIANTPIYGNNLLKMFFSRTGRPMTLRLGMKHWECGPYQDCINDDTRLTLSYFTTRSNTIQFHLYRKNLEMFTVTQYRVRASGPSGPLV